MPAVTTDRPLSARLTRRLLTCGVLAGPLFIGVVLVQDYLRPGVEPRTQPLSLLTLGDLGWVQVGAFVLAGLANLAFAVGARRVLFPGPAGLLGPLLIGGYGLGLVGAGLFVPDPASGFPPGALPTPATDPSWHADLHTAAVLLVFACLVLATAVFAHRFAGQRDLVRARGSALVGLAVLGLVVVAADPDRAAVALRAAVLLGWLWASWLAHVLRAPGRPPRAGGAGPADAAPVPALVG